MQFVSFENPIKACISDSKRYCCATFSSEFAADFQKKHTRALTELKGCLFKISSFTIIVATSETLEYQITLAIDEWKWIKGRTGESAYGNPELISSKEPVMQLMKTLFNSINTRNKANADENSENLKETDSGTGPSGDLSVGEAVGRKPALPSEEPTNAKRMPSCASSPNNSLIKPEDLAKSRRSTWWIDLEIRRSSIEVPKDQQTLLSRRESWYPPEPGKRFPVANIPLSVLQQLNAIIEKQARHHHQQGKPSSDDNPVSRPTTTSENEIRNGISPEQISELEQSDDDADRPFPSVEWPSSSPRNAIDPLPPDSSPLGVSGELPMQLMQSPSIKPASYQEQPMTTDTNNDGSAHLQAKQPGSPVDINRSDSLHTRSSSDPSIIDWALQQPVTKPSLPGAQLDGKSVFEDEQRSPESQKLRSIPTRMKRPAENLPAGSAPKRTKTMQPVQGESSRPQLSQNTIKYKSERSKFFANYIDAHARNKMSSPSRAVTSTTLAQALPTSSDKTSSSAGGSLTHASPVSPRRRPPTQNSRSVSSRVEGTREMNSEDPPRSASYELNERPNGNSSSKLPEFLKRRGSQTELLRQSRKPESTANSSPVRDSHFITGSEQRRDTVDIFERFATTYPEYKGDRKHFHNLCKKLSTLQSQGKAQHRSLWDDFIIRHKTDYVSYLGQVATEGGDPLAYEDYYNEEVEEPLIRKRVVNPATLKTALEQPIAPNSGYSTRTMTVSTRTPEKAGNSMKIIEPSSREMHAELTHPVESSGDVGEQKPIEVNNSDDLNDAATLEHNHPLDNGVLEPPPGLVSSDMTRTTLKASIPTKAKTRKRSQRHVKRVVDSESEISEFWKDRNTPFKEYARAYASLKSVDGRLGTISEKDGIVRPNFKRIDSMRWRL